MLNLEFQKNMITRIFKIHAVKFCFKIYYTEYKYLKNIAKSKNMHYKGFAKIIMPSNYVVSEKVETEANAIKIIKDSLPLLDTLSNLINSDKNFNEPKK